MKKLAFLFSILVVAILVIVLSGATEKKAMALPSIIYNAGTALDKPHTVADSQNEDIPVLTIRKKGKI